MTSVKAFLVTLGLVLPSELGDKTQIVILALAARYSWRGVLGGSMFG